jgi:nicotinamide-nucleotide amidase
VQNCGMAGAGLTGEAARIAERIADVAREKSLKVAVAESLTSGNIARRLGAAPEAISWFSGGVIAYASEVKFKVLDVDPGPVVTAECAAQMARGVARLAGADFAVAVTGVGGPEPYEGHPAGTVFLAVSSGSDEEVAHHRFEGEPPEVVELATVAALHRLLTALEEAR